MTRDRLTHTKIALATLAATGSLAFLATPPALAASSWWHLTSGTTPSQLPPAPGTGQVVVTVTDLGDAPVDGEAEPITIADTLAPGLKADAIDARQISEIPGTEEVECSLAHLTCTDRNTLPAYAPIEVIISVTDEHAESGEPNRVSVSGGGTSPAAFERAITVSGAAVPFGVQYFELSPEEADGAPDAQAGSHPFQLTTTLILNQVLSSLSGQLRPEAAALPKDLDVNTPPGLVGNPTPLPQCTIDQFLRPSVQNPQEDECPPQTAVGVATVTIVEPALGVIPFTQPIFNLEPAVGEPARFGFFVNGSVPVILDTSVRTGGDYGVTVSSQNITEETAFLRSQTTFWGVPGDPRHNDVRGWGCLAQALGASGFAPCTTQPEPKPKPFLTLPTSCTGPLVSTVEADSWAHAGSFSSVSTSEPMEALDGCNRVPFNPSISVTPDGASASTPSGLTVGVHLPREADLSTEGLSEADVKDTTVALPEGVAVNSAGADGLETCADLPEPGRPEGQIALHSIEAANCPEASKIGLAEVTTPDLPNPLKGSAYLAAQNANPFGSLLALYLVMQDPVSGVLVKLAGEVHLTESGQIVSTFKNTPQLPFETFKVKFFGGARAPMVTPARCGTYTTTTSLTPWTENPPATPSSSFAITSGPGGGPCPSVNLPFTPSFTGGATNIQAGAYTPTTTTVTREDGNQNLRIVQLHYPPGLTGLLTNVKLCAEAQANEGKCGSESEIGESIVSVGLGGDPFTVTGGKVYITEKYDGAPFGLSIVNPAKAGPFDLERDTSNPADQAPCDCVVTRAKIEVNPSTSALTITTDPSGPYAIPSMIDGIPLEIKHVYVAVNRPGFTVNPTNCEPMAITGTLSGDEGASSAFSTPFQVTNCALLSFTPKFAVLTAGQASKADGASLVFKITYPQGSLGTQAWFNEAKFTLPKQLPARLSTIQQACLSSVFESNRAECPSASIIGHAVVRTQVLPVPLEGPVYFVSYGSARFPEVVIFLQGYGVTVELHGETFISQQGVTSATFRNQPEVPFESIEVNVPTGPYSEFGANLPAKDKYNFCGQKLTMPTFFKAADGAEIHEDTPVTVTGCSKVKKHEKKGKKASEGKRK